MKKYIRIKSDEVNTIFLPPDPEVIMNHLKTYYLGDNLIDWFDGEEVLEISVVEMSEEEYKKLPEWEP